MRIKTFVIGYALALCVLLCAQRRPGATPPAGFRGVIDLTHTVSRNVPTYEPRESAAYQVKTVATIEKDGYFAREIALPEHFGTHIDAPAYFARGRWTGDQTPAARLVCS